MDRRKALIVCILCVIFIFFAQGGVMAGTLSRAEKMSDAEKVELATAEKKVVEAQKEVESVKRRIAEAHNMKGESWMEWRSWIEFDGDYILYRFKSHMEIYGITTK